MHQQRFHFPFIVVQTPDTKDNILDIVYSDLEKKTKLSFATKQEFEVMADVDLLIEHKKLQELRTAAESPNDQENDQYYE